MTAEEVGSMWSYAGLLVTNADAFLFIYGSQFESYISLEQIFQIKLLYS